LDILDRLLRHDVWTTRQLLLYCRTLTPTQLNQTFDIGHETLQKTLEHIIRNMEVWTDLMYQRPIQTNQDTSIEGMLTRLDLVGADFAALAHEIRDKGREDELWTDYLDEPPAQKTYGGTIAHLITHSIHHRSEVLHILKRLGVSDLIEGDVLSWEQHYSQT
jgi:uncharacterized damage-inducible protein DinB